MTGTDRNGMKLMTNVQMCDRLSETMDKIVMLAEISRAADSDMNACKGGVAYVIDEIFNDVSDVYETIDANREAERQAMAKKRALDPTETATTV